MAKTNKFGKKFISNEAMRRERKLARGSILVPTADIYNDIRRIKEILKDVNTPSEILIAEATLKATVNTDSVRLYFKNPELFANI